MHGISETFSRYYLIWYEIIQIFFSMLWYLSCREIFLAFNQIYSLDSLYELKLLHTFSKVGLIFKYYDNRKYWNRNLIITTNGCPILNWKKAFVLFYIRLTTGLKNKKILPKLNFWTFINYLLKNGNNMSFIKWKELSKSLTVKKTFANSWKI